MNPSRPVPDPVSTIHPVAPSEHRAGFVAIIGQPNVGKSTLLNQILGEKLAIVSPKPQTTRVRLLGVKHLPDAQLALVDTPGLHRPSEHRQTLLNRYMVEEARAAASDVDALLLVVDVSAAVGQANRGKSSEEPAPPPRIDATDRFIVEQLAALRKPLILALNKVDLCRDKLRLLPYIEQWNALREFVAIVPISALTGRGIELLVDELRRALPPGPPLFPDDTLTDSSERTLVAERIREQLCLQTKKELPYASAVTVDGWEERKGTHGAKAGERLAVVIHATIHVEKPNQKLIVIGEKGSRIREIGTAARQDIAALLGCPVHLELFVRVDEEWSHSRAGLRDMGYTPSHERRA